MSQSNKRYFNTYFFEDPYVEDLDSDLTLLFMTLILNPHNNMAGCYELSINKLVSYTKLPEQKVRAGIQRLQEDRKILFTGTWMTLKNFIKNNQLNPNMCKNAFDIMRTAPKESIIFMISDANGNAEPWLSDFVEKVGKGVNASIDSKNRNAIKKAKDNGLAEPIPEPNVNFTMDSFISGVLDRVKALPNGTIGGTVPPTITKPLGEPSVEYKEEYEKEYEYEVEEEKEMDTSPSPSFKSYFDQVPQEKNLIDRSITYWNTKEILPKTKTFTMNLGEKARVINEAIVPYSYEEITKAIDNYSEIRSNPDKYDTFITYGDVFGFLSTGVAKFWDGAMPLTQFSLSSPSPSEFNNETMEERAKREYQEYKERKAKEGTQ